MASPATTAFRRDARSTSLEVHLLGTVDFESALSLQEQLGYEISGRNDTHGGLILCEHPPLVTVGREGSRAHILADDDELASRQIDVRWVNRGGGCIAHAPGQLAVYPIVPLDRLQLGLSAYRRLLEQSVVDVCRGLRVSGELRNDEPGVWCRCGQVAHVGVAVKSWVSYHGLFVNVSPALDAMRFVRANRSGTRVTSLSAQRVRVTSMQTVRAGIVRALTARLGYAWYHVYTGHPLLQRTRRRVHVTA
jgi:lipoyl(octanoyl) transferase